MVYGREGQVTESTVLKGGEVFKRGSLVSSGGDGEGREGWRGELLTVMSSRVIFLECFRSLVFV